VSFILVDWTRMGDHYCLAGFEVHGDWVRTVRPLQAHLRRDDARGKGWSALSVAGRGRWELFDLVHPQPAASQPPHREDVWVRDLVSTHTFAPPELRQFVLRATDSVTTDGLFGEPLRASRSGRFLDPGRGRRSLTTLLVRADRIRFDHCPDTTRHAVRVRIGVPGLEDSSLPVTDHHLLLHAERQAPQPRQVVAEAQRRIDGMGSTVAVRFGLSRPYAPGDAGEPVCWLMANGFFSLADPES
jgi:Dual OB-containing domain